MRTISPDALPSSVLEISYLLAKPPIIPIELDKLSRAILRRQQGRLRKDSKVLDLLSPDTALGGAKPT